MFQTRNETVTRNLGLIGLALRQPCCRVGVAKLGFEDSWQIGALALVRAVEGYNPTLGFAFSTYAVCCIINAVSRAAEQHSRSQHQQLPVDDEGEVLVEPEAPAEPDPIIRAEAERLLRHLLPQERDAVERTVMNGQTLDVAGQAMGISLQRVAQLRDRAFDRLRRQHADRLGQS